MAGEWSKLKTIELVRGRALLGFIDTVDTYSDWIPCECCGVWCIPEMHHRKFRSRGGDWRPSNIVALCPLCHHQVTTSHNGWAEEMGLAVSQFAQPEAIAVSVWYEPNPIMLDNDGGWTLLDNVYQ